MRETEGVTRDPRPPHDDAPTEPAPPSDGAPRRRHRRVVRVGTETTSVRGLSADERAEGWSEPPTTSHDADLLRDLPPHWGGAGYRD